MNIRMARETDFPQWLPLWKGYQRFYKTDIPEATTATAQCMGSAASWKRDQVVAVVASGMSVL